MSVCIHTQTSTPSYSPPATDPNILINMESQEQEAMGANSSTDDGPTPVIVKRRRTKRHAVPPPPLTAATTAMDSSSASSADESGITDMEEDMANCLILLARGHATEDCGGGSGAGKFTSRKFAETATTAGGRAGFYVYECKTCSRCFPSFQALGGHRASHKKLKMAAAEPAASLQKGIVDEGDLDPKIINSFSKTVAFFGIGAGGKAKVHECSICGSEFSSGQALGGHMRRHRPAGQPEDNKEQKKEKNVLSVDLNLPAPADDDSTFAAAGKPLIFSAAISAVLVDCHY